MTETIVLWAFALVAVFATGVQIYSIMQARYLERVLNVQFQSLNETYLLGYEALTTSLRAVENRVKVLEEEVL